MTRILVQRGSGSSNQSRAGSSTAARPDSTPQAVSTVRDEEIGEEVQEQAVADEFLENSGSNDNKVVKSDELLTDSINDDQIESVNDGIVDNEKKDNDEGVGSGDLVKGLSGLILERSLVESEGSSAGYLEVYSGSPQPPPPPVPPPKSALTNTNSRRLMSGPSNSVRIGPSRRAVAWPVVSTRSSPAGSRPSSPRSHDENEGYNSGDEQNPCSVSSYDDFERERQFEIDIRRSKGLEVKKMLEDGNCLFRAVADQVYGDSEMYDVARQMCIDYMVTERDHFSQFITEGYTSYCKRKRRDKVYGNNVEIQALSEMYNRPIHIYSYSTEPINIFHGSYNTDTPPIRLSYHHGNHYNSLVNPRRSTIGAGLGFSCLQEASVDRDQVKAAIKAQQDRQIDNALLAEGRFHSDLELTEKEIERMVMEASRAEYIADNMFKPQLGRKESSTSGAEPSSSGASKYSDLSQGMGLG
ncbi:OTU DOMAIN-CONTAINING PROTEIN 5-LIKE ISOFORM X1 [Salix purpurea]|uniref:OTU DOMAIN-CONTAINING PROTEIN 5-LIKE ISOFORM X1 n=1 Tax=Salix purpurea TaxID=77065 RepID=A0A9Q0PRU8_SALPP|nr:OTU DOMAIN-CONTAINING PROTEIN 5-LIKE ISOFORM X1 [Salix purpurea]